MKKVIKKKLEETKQHAFEKKVLQREKAKGAPRVGEFYKENDILLEDIDLGQIRIDMKREGEDITTEEIIETTKIIPLKDHMIEITIYERKDQKDSKEKIDEKTIWTIAPFAGSIFMRRGYEHDYPYAATYSPLSGRTETD